MLNEVPYVARVAALLVVMGIAASIDLWKHRRKATRWKEYPFLLAAGLVTGLFGMANDLVTSSISPDYYVLGKGLSIDSLPQSAMTLGLKAGFSGGAIASAFCVWAATRQSGAPKMRLTTLSTMLWRPFFMAVIFSVFFLALASFLDPLRLGSRLDSMLTYQEIVRFKQVWWMHTGLYTGFITGTVWSILSINRQRRRTGDTSSNQGNQPERTDF